APAGSAENCSARSGTDDQTLDAGNCWPADAISRCIRTAGLRAAGMARDAVRDVNDLRAWAGPSRLFADPDAERVARTRLDFGDDAAAQSRLVAAALSACARRNAVDRIAGHDARG